MIPTYNISYDGNGNTGGSAPADDIEYEVGMTVTVKTNSGDLSRDGYSFIGWNTEADGSGTDLAPSSTFSMGAEDETLYAQWETVEY